jgi:hypothetical protein
MTGMQSKVHWDVLLSVVVTLVWATAAAVVGGHVGPDDVGDPLVGEYVGTMKVTGLTGKDGVTPRPDCGSCHAAGRVTRDADAYTLALTLQQSSSRANARVTLKGRRDGDRVVFRNDTYSLTLSAGQLTGDRAARMRGTLSLGKPGAASRPASQPGTLPASS